LFNIRLDLVKETESVYSELRLRSRPWTISAAAAEAKKIIAEREFVDLLVVFL